MSWLQVEPILMANTASNQGNLVKYSNRKQFPFLYFKEEVLAYSKDIHGKLICLGLRKDHQQPKLMSKQQAFQVQLQTISYLIERKD